MNRSLRLVIGLMVGVLSIGSLAALDFSIAKAEKPARALRAADLPKIAAAKAGLPPIVINELDADQTGADAAEFVELKTVPGTNLNGLVVVFYNGSSDTSYSAFDLAGQVADANGFFIIGNAGVPGVDIVIPGDGLQNGQDAVALYAGTAANFPAGTAVTATNIIDAVVYDTADADDAGLLDVLLLPGAARVQVDENGAGTGITVSVRRCSQALRDGRAFSIGTPTPNAANTGCPAPADGRVDLNGDGASDYLIVRENAPALNSGSIEKRSRLSMREILRNRVANQESLAQGVGPITWWGLNSNDFGVSTVQWGDSGVDNPMTADFDGDGRDDITVWRPNAQGSHFYSINSSDFTVRDVTFGGPLDNPYAVADYDGDGKDDPATYRCPTGTPGQCYFYYRPSSIPNPGDWAVAWGFGEGFDFLPLVGDYDGDGLDDFCVQGASPSNPNNGVFYISHNGDFDFKAVEWGELFDRLVSADFDGDGANDITVTRVDENDVLWWYVYENDGGIQLVPWGDGLDFEAPGDYNGDGKDDFGAYRWNTTDATFWILPGGGGSPSAVTWGQPGDVPLAYYLVQ